jgi:triphosphatase
MTNALPPAQLYHLEQEVEVKFTCDPVIFPRVLNLSEPMIVSAAQLKHLQSTYFDTADWRLHNAGVSLRIRSDEAEKSFWCIKSLGWGANSTFGRNQFEVSALGVQPDLGQFGPDVAQHLSQIIGQNEIAQRFSIGVHRQSLLLRHRSSELEITLDAGEVSAGSAREEFNEIELELKAGHERHLIDFAMLLLQELPLSLNFVTKADRGFALVTRRPASWKTARPCPTTASFNLGQILARALSSSLEHFTRNWAALLEGFEPEATHQLRIALRRFRDLTGFYNDTFRLPDLRNLRKKAKIIGKALGSARSLDVLLKSLSTFKALPHINQQALATLLAQVEQHHARAYENVRDVIRDRAASRFVLEAQDLILQCEDIARPAGAAAVEGAALGKIQSSETMTRLHGAILKRGRGFSKLSNKQLHSLRLKVKLMRHATSTFPEIAGAKLKVAGYEQSLAKFQKVLGNHNDHVFAVRFLRSLSKDEPADIKSCVKHLLREIRRRDRLELGKLKVTWKTFRISEPYWN